MIHIKKEHKSILDTYFIKSADWEYVIESSSHNEAGSKALEKMFDVEGKNLKLSPVILSLNCTKYCEDLSEDNYQLLSTSMILSNIGMHDLSKKFKKLIK